MTMAVAFPRKGGSEKMKREDHDDDFDDADDEINDNSNETSHLLRKSKDDYDSAVVMICNMPSSNSTLQPTRLDHPQYYLPYRTHSSASALASMSSSSHRLGHGGLSSTSLGAVGSASRGYTHEDERSAGSLEFYTPMGDEDFDDGQYLFEDMNHAKMKKMRLSQRKGFCSHCWYRFWTVWKHPRRIMMVVGLGLVLVLLSHVALLRSSSSSSSSPSNDNDDLHRHHDDHYDHPNRHHAPPLDGNDGLMSPLSLKDPVRDMDILPLHRPTTSRPPVMIQTRWRAFPPSHNHQQHHQHHHQLKQELHQPLQQQQRGHHGHNGPMLRPWMRSRTATANAAATTPPEDDDGVVPIAIPTHAWYQNMLSVKDGDEPSPVHRAYAIPLVVDAVGPIPGLRVHPNYQVASQTVIQLTFVDDHGITLGTAPDAYYASDDQHDETPPSPLSHAYSAVAATPLAVTLQWSSFPMNSTIARGMPYATMHYSEDAASAKPSSSSSSSSSSASPNPVHLLPTIASRMDILKEPVADGGTVSIPCGLFSSPPRRVEVEREVELSFKDSDFTWLVFFSEPVTIQCVKRRQDNAVLLQIIEMARHDEDDDEEEEKQEASNLGEEEDEDENGGGGGGDVLTIRAALLNNCTTGRNPMYCDEGKPNPPEEIDAYAALLRKSAALYPGPLADVSYMVHDEEDGDDEDRDAATITFDWDVRNMTRKNHHHDDLVVHHDENGNDGEIIVFALPHHHDILEGAVAEGVCVSTLIGSSCIVRGSTWRLHQTLPSVGFTAPRPPKASAIPALMDALQSDLGYRLPEYYQRAAGDTYFSGKMLARQARILMIAKEMDDLCGNDGKQVPEDSYREACSKSRLPSEEDRENLLTSLREGIDVWINGMGVVPFVYDVAWGSIISCGCVFDGQTCRQTYPDCPAVQDPGLNFGNGFFNDHLFHYGYFLYAAAAVATFDRQWGRDNFERMLLLVRDVANPSDEDTFFPRCRHKDWYRGNSFASGIAMPYLNGKNQESSSEAIAGYEAVALFGQVMAEAWAEKKGAVEEKRVAEEVYDVGRVLLATEIRSTDWYYHLRNHQNVYPDIYKEKVVGILWSTMAQFQTWFGNQPYLAYGIQLLPLTPASEQRDDLDWLMEMYPRFAATCSQDANCEGMGWSMLQSAVLAAVGHIDEAMERALELPRAVFETPGGNGHSLSNTLWYIATRPELEDPLALPEASSNGHEANNSGVAPNEDGGGVGNDDDDVVLDCGLPETCTADVMQRLAGEYSCRDRIHWLMTAMGQSEQSACAQVAGVEQTASCGPCHPGDEYIDPIWLHNKENPPECPPCSEEECRSELNRCPIYPRTFVCSEGHSRGGCTPMPWKLSPAQCHACCELTECGTKYSLSSSSDQKMQEVHPAAAGDEGGDSQEDTLSCPPCESTVCQSQMGRLCPLDEAPYLCTEGDSSGGCSPHEWTISTKQCQSCCLLTPDCRA